MSTHLRIRKVFVWSFPLVFTLSFEKLTSDLDFGMCMDHVNTSPWTESQGYGSRSRIRVKVNKESNAVGLTSILDCHVNVCSVYLV